MGVGGFSKPSSSRAAIQTSEYMVLLQILIMASSVECGSSERPIVGWRRKTRTRTERIIKRIEEEAMGIGRLRRKDDGMKEII